MTSYIKKYIPEIPTFPYQEKVLEGAEIVAEWGKVYSPDHPAIAAIKGIKAVRSPFKLHDKINKFQNKLNQWEEWVSTRSLEVITSGTSAWKRVGHVARAVDKYVMPILSPFASLVLKQASLAAELVGSLAYLILNTIEIYAKSDVEITGEKTLFIACMNFMATFYVFTIALILAVAALLEVSVSPILVAGFFTFSFLTSLLAEFYDKIL